MIYIFEINFITGVKFSIKINELSNLKKISYLVMKSRFSETEIRESKMDRDVRDRDSETSEIWKYRFGLFNWLKKNQSQILNFQFRFYINLVCIIIMKNLLMDTTSIVIFRWILFDCWATNIFTRLSWSYWTERSKKVR
jgi:hypothetical protein